MDNKFSHFYQRSEDQRRAIIADAAHLDETELQLLKHRAETGDAKALIENYVTAYQLPEGVAVNLTLNGRTVVVPMVTEEPSVIAAASNGAKLASDAGGVTATVEPRLLMGQIVLQNVSVFASVDDWVALHRQQLLDVAAAAHPSLIARGGGPRRLRVRNLGDGFVSIDLFVDVQAAMGANMMNTMLEAVAGVVQSQLHPNTLFSILSNAADQSLATATVSIPVNHLATSQMAGKTVADRISAASQVAQLDPYRAVTHNKGIMNGVDAVVLAMGNDWRAIESAAHAYAVTNGQYRGLSQWQVTDDQLVGTLTLPLPVGTAGGATRVLPVAQVNQRMAQISDVSQLMAIVVAVGLVQNLAALKALVTTGIQQGHMKMQLRSLAMSVGAETPAEISAVTTSLTGKKDPSEAAAKRALQEFRMEKDD
ncbi:hydroxymethylglutaryl-CoA reductase, degradative [Secundilactobacillus kimchicus]|uniref:hydroxymethylglutaryl-CoA reductase, degradative n=1 Tax=Secundilactobacillus kimchicus TaxID=528209 RepID=UPI001C033E24|nr:hydroxymethylglutaryl-CoA reductase, degradative [Secundilactobacillus kimchicus]MBT9670753.1 hydroxymethylglutaryl-CoA reductase, degradative [Secundilactobacillus kimchicus]